MMLKSAMVVGFDPLGPLAQRRKQQEHQDQNPAAPFVGEIEEMAEHRSFSFNLLLARGMPTGWIRGDCD